MPDFLLHNKTRFRFSGPISVFRQKMKRKCYQSPKVEICFFLLSVSRSLHPLQLRIKGRNQFKISIEKHFHNEWVNKTKPHIACFSATANKQKKLSTCAQSKYFCEYFFFTWNCVLDAIKFAQKPFYFSNARLLLPYAIHAMQKSLRSLYFPEKVIKKARHAKCLI